MDDKSIGNVDWGIEQQDDAEMEDLSGDSPALQDLVDSSEKHQITWDEVWGGGKDEPKSKIEGASEGPIEARDDYHRAAIVGNTEIHDAIEKKEDGWEAVNHPLVDRLLNRSFDPTKEIVPIKFSLKRKDAYDSIHDVARDSNIILVKGKPGTRKSTFVRAMSSGVFSQKHSLGFIFETKGDVIFIDAEQDLATFQSDQRQFYTMAGFDFGRKHPNYHPYIVTPDSIEEKLAMIELSMSIHKNAKYIIIDQLAAICQNYNDQTEAEALTSTIKRWAFDNSITPIIVMHTNFGTGKANGVLGSEMEKVANVVFHLETEGDSTKVSNTKIRGTKPLDPFYVYHGEDRMPVLQDFGNVNW